MASVVEERQADYLPDSYGAPVAAGPEIESLDVRSQRLEGGRYRKPVPSQRQSDEGMEFPQLEAAPERIEVEEARPRKRRWYEGVNPFTIPGPKTPLIVFGLMYLIGGWDDAALSLIAPELRAEFGFSIQTLANMGAIVGIATVLLGLPAGYLVDRVKRVRLVRIGAIGGNVANIAKAFAANGGQYYGSQMFGVATQIAASPVGFPLMTDYYPSRARARVSAFLGVCTRVGGLIGPLIGGALITIYGWRSAVFALAVLGTVVAFLTFLLKEPVRGGMDRLEMGVSRERAAVEQAPPSWQEALRGAWAIRTLRRQVYASLVITLAQQPVSLLTGLIMAEKFFLDPFQRAMVLQVIGIFGIPSLIIGGAVADRLLAHKPGTLVAAQSSLFFISATSTLLMALVPNVFLFMAMSVVTGLLGAMLAPAGIVITSLVIPARYRGLGLQIGVPFLLVGIALGPVLIGFAQDMPIQQGILFFTPFLFLGGMIALSSAATVERDIRAARAASLAQEESAKAAAAGEAKLLVCRDVDVAYDGVQVLFNVDLDVMDGECLALLGTNGSGKSTLLRAIAGIQEADNGAIFFDGRDITHVPAHENARAGIVMMPGGQAVFADMTVRENLTTAARLYHEDPERVLGFFPVLRERLDLPAASLSGGEQQMLALGQAFLMRPRLLMVDELSLGLAPAVIEQLLGILREIRANGTSVILVEQSLNVALTVAERAVFMEKGAISFDGPTEDLLRRPDLVRSIFMGGAVSAVTGARKARRSSYEEPENVLSASGLTVTFGGVKALDDVSVEVAAGEIVGIVGPNGAGKTTLFDALSGYVEPASGRVLLSGDDISSLSPDARARAGLGRAFQNARLFGPLTVRENIAIALERRTVRSAVLGALWMPQVRRSERRIWARVDGYIEILGLEPYADKFVRELSTGTRRAVEVACVMAAEPKMLLLDEPSSGLAQAETEALGPALARIVRETGCGLLVIEHDLPLITTLSDRLVAMDLGRVVVTGTPAEVTAHPHVLQSYLAASSDVIERSGSRVGAVLNAIRSEGDGRG